MGKTDEAHQVASSTPSRQKGKPPTTITSIDALAMLESALWYYRNSGMIYRMGNSNSQENTALLALPGVRVCQKCKRLKLFEDMHGDVCAVCAEAAHV